MKFKNYKHLELLEEGISIAARRISDNKISNVKNWKPTNPFRLRVNAIVRRGDKRHVKKRTYVYEDEYMVDALKAAQRELDDLLVSIKEELIATTISSNDQDRMFTFDEAFRRSLNARKLEANANGDVFRSYDMIDAFYKNHLKEHLATLPLNKISKELVTKIRANLKHKKSGKAFSPKTKLAVLQHINPVYTWFNEYSNLRVKSPAKIPKGAMKKLGNERDVEVADIKPLFNAMYNYQKEPYRSVFVWLLHGRRVNEVLSLDWENINLTNSTYTITSANNKAKIDMTYTLTPYQLETLGKPKKKGLVFPSKHGKQISGTIIWDHWKKVRLAVGTWTLNNKQVDHTELHLHDMRHLIATELFNKYKVMDELSGAVLGHTRSSVTARYAKVLRESVNDVVVKLLDEVLV